MFHYVDAIEHNVTSTRDRVDDLLNRIKADMEKLRLFEENDTPGLIGSAAFYGEISLIFFFTSLALTLDLFLSELFWVHFVCHHSVHILDSFVIAIDHEP